MAPTSPLRLPSQWRPKGRRRAGRRRSATRNGCNPRLAASGHGRGEPVKLHVPDNSTLSETESDSGRETEPIPTETTAAATAAEIPLSHFREPVTGGLVPRRLPLQAFADQREAEQFENMRVELAELLDEVNTCARRLGALDANSSSTTTETNRANDALDKCAREFDNLSPLVWGLHATITTRWLSA